MKMHKYKDVYALSHNIIHMFICLYLCAFRCCSRARWVKVAQPGVWEPAPKKVWQLEISSQSEEMVVAPKQLGVIPGSCSQSSHNAQGLKEPIGPRRRPAGPYKYCIGARKAPEKKLFRDSF